MYAPNTEAPKYNKQILIYERRNRQLYNNPRGLQDPTFNNG